MYSAGIAAWAASFSPVLRLQYKPEATFSSSLDLGVGISYQSEKDIQKKKSTAINIGGHNQFEIRAIVGTRVNTSQSFEITFGLFHYSNTNLHSANEGMDFYVSGVSLPF
ncbi:acyloxyacyl hydrolase [Sansalvadorimonas sp. 2012CJ34-2]|uniref:Acyloxyacyl hydrolase n=1 Tax=Parendozoicomonas callyspongiae TaxID=2942213 RepID=A0ABT0PBZ7_9GAMM|nr:acyloxyacyl hydrolase [Sansalvadorimonas sp. 2012CJ34-2]